MYDDSPMELDTDASDDELAMQIKDNFTPRTASRTVEEFRGMSKDQRQAKLINMLMEKRKTQPSEKVSASLQPLLTPTATSDLDEEEIHEREPEEEEEDVHDREEENIISSPPNRDGNRLSRYRPLTEDSIPVRPSSPPISAVEPYDYSQIRVGQILRRAHGSETVTATRKRNRFTLREVPENDRPTWRLFFEAIRLDYIRRGPNPTLSDSDSSGNNRRTVDDRDSIRAINGRYHMIFGNEARPLDAHQMEAVTSVRGYVH